MTGSVRAALRDLSRAQKSRRGVSLYSRWVNRPIGRLFAALAFSAGLSPNAVSLISGAVTAAGLVVIGAVPPTVPTGIVASILLVLGFALDSADGQVARLSGRGSRAGEWLDHVLDAGKIVLIHSAVLITALLHAHLPLWAVGAPIAFQAIAVVVFVGGLLQSQLAPRRTDSDAPASRVRPILLLPADYGVLALSFALLGWPMVFAGVYVALLAANALIGAALLVRWFRSLDGNATPQSRN